MKTYFSSSPRRPGNREGGFSLVELMVTVVVSMVAVLVMYQMAENWDKRKRTTGSGSDAQTAGYIGIYTLERDLKQAGFGFSGTDAGNVSYLGCTVSATSTDRPTNAFTFPFVPVLITDGASGAPDTLTVLYGSSSNAATSMKFTASTNTNKTLNLTAGIRAGELAIVADSSNTNCGLIEITANDYANKIVSHGTSAYTDYKGNAGVVPKFNGITTAFTAGKFYNLGYRTNPRRNIWSIRDGRVLTVVDDLHYVDVTGPATAATPPTYPPDGANDWQSIAEGVINLQAQYGLSTSLNCSGISTWQSTAPADWNKVCAVRVGLLVRSQNYEKEAVTTNAPQWQGGAFTMFNVDGSASGAADGTANDWRNYRYRVYETVVPLRNVAWGSGQY